VVSWKLLNVTTAAKQQWRQGALGFHGPKQAEEIHAKTFLIKYNNPKLQVLG